MKKYFIHLFLCVGTLQILAQEVRFPYLIEGKYAIANKEGVLLTEAIYEDVIITKDQPFIAVKKDGLWGYLNYKGQIILQPVLKVEVKPNVLGLHGPSAMPVGRIWSTDTTGRYPFAKSNLYYAKIWPNAFFFNPFVPNDKVQPFRDNSKINHDSRSRYENGNFDRTGLYKVATPDVKINFLDTAGMPIFKQSVFDGFDVSAHVIAVENENKKFALFDRNQKALTDFIYDEVKVIDDGNFIQTQQRGACPEEPILTSHPTACHDTILTSEFWSNRVTFF